MTAPHPRPQPTRAQRAVAFMFLAAFGATILTVIFTGLSVRNASQRRAAATDAVALTVGEPRRINLVFDSRLAIADVEFTVDLPAGVEFDGQAGNRRVVGRAKLAAGHNVLPLAVIAREGNGGSLAVRLRAGRDRKVFVVDLTLRPL